MFTEMKNNSSLPLKYTRFDASIGRQSVTLINIDELFKKPDSTQVRHKKAKIEKNSLFTQITVNLSNYKPSLKPSRYSLLKQYVY